MRLAVLALLATLLPGLALGGAWPREEGGVFYSLSYRAEADWAALGSPRTLQADSFTSFYLEYGAGPRLTFGLDAGYPSDAQYSAIAFARYTLSAPGARHQWAISAGAGVAGPVAEAQVQLGAHWGTGIETPWAPGWIGLDVTARRRLASPGTITKADLTFGLRPAEGWMAILQVQAGRYPGDPDYLRLAPSVVKELTPGQRIEIGIDADILGSGRVGARIGTWTEF